MSADMTERLARTPLSKTPAAVMLTTASVTDDLRHEMAAGTRPVSEYWVLERDYGVNLVDWTELRPRPTRRSVWNSLVHVGTAWGRRGQVSAVLSDGEHLGLPLAVALSQTKHRPGHVFIGHRMSTRSKRWLASSGAVRRGVDLIIVHSELQAEMLVEVGLRPEQIRLVHYGVDTDFWSPRGAAPPGTRPLIVAAGREHRDYRSLLSASQRLDVDVCVADGSTYSPQSPADRPEEWPSRVWRGSLPAPRLRELYDRAAVIVVPLLETDFQAGITVIAEAMAMGKPVVVSATAGLRGALGDPGAVRTVPPGDPPALRAAIADLLALPQDATEEIGRKAREGALRHHSITDYAATLYSLIEEVRRHD